MRYMIMIHATAYSEARVPASREAGFEMAACLAEMAAAGVLVAEELLAPSSGGIRMTPTPEGGEPDVDCGPFPAGPDAGLLAAFVVIDVDAIEEALRWTRKLASAQGVGRAAVELRRLEEKPGGRQDIGLERELADQLAMLDRNDDIRRDRL